MEITQSALYQYCKLAVSERMAWNQHEEAYTDDLKTEHHRILGYLMFELRDDPATDYITVSFTLPKSDLETGS